MAEVYRAKRFGAQGFAKYLALKRIRPEYNEEAEFVDMFIDEAKILVNLSHPNIVQVYDFGSVAGNYYISMEYVSGAQLSRLIRQLLQNNKRLPLATSLFIAKEIARGLGYAHSQTDPGGQPLGLVHRDVSPQNIMISWHGDVKILDFGVARAANKISSSNSGQLKGKFAYMSPEQASGHDIDHRTDLFAAGILLWEMIAAQRLFKSDSEIKTLKLVQACEVPPLSQVAAPVPEGLDEVVARALARNPEERYQSGADLERDLTRLLYTTDASFTPANLANLMTGEFERDIKKERRMMRKYEERMSRYGMIAMVDGAVAFEDEDLMLEPADSETETVSDSGISLKDEPLLSTPTGKGEMLLPEESAPLEVLTGSMVTYQPGRNRSVLFAVLAAVLVLGAGLGFWFAQSSDAVDSETASAAASADDELPAADDDGDSAEAAGDDDVDTEDGTGVGDDSEGDGAEATADGTTDDGDTAVEDGTAEGDDGEEGATADATGDDSAAVTAKPGVKSKPRPKRKKATLNVNSNPWGKIYINGRDTGKTTPAKGLSVPAGKVTVKIVNPKGLSSTTTVSLEPGASETILEKLK